MLVMSENSWNIKVLKKYLIGSQELSVMIEYIRSQIEK